MVTCSGWWNSNRPSFAITRSNWSALNLYRFGDFAVRVDVVADWVADYQLTRCIRYSVVPQLITDIGQRRKSLISAQMDDRRPLDTTRLLALDGEYSPFVGHALQHVRSAVGKRDPRARHQVLDRGRHENLARSGER